MYKQPNLINYSLLEDPKQTYVLPIFIRPGRTHFFIREPLEDFNPILTKQKFVYHYSRHVVQARLEEIPKIAKQMKKDQ